METIKLFAIGIILGVANVIPGVSGGTMAVVFGIYNRLIDLISLNVKKIFSQWKFILPLGAGLVTGVLLFSKIITFLFNKFPIQTNWFFIGIILGSIPMIFTHWLNAKKQTPLPNQTEPTDQTDQTEQTEQATQNAQATKSKKIPISSIICCAMSLTIMILMVIFKSEKPETQVTPGFSLYNAIIMFVGLAIAAIAMIIPGISGSFIMLALGIYSTVIGAIDSFNIYLLIPGALGAIAGLLCGAKLVRILMSKIPSQTYGIIFGLILGSVFVIFPTAGYSPLIVLTSIVCAAAGFLVSFLFSKTEKSE